MIKMVNAKIAAGTIILLLFIFLNIFIWNLFTDDEKEEVEEPETVSDKELKKRADGSLQRILQEEIENCEGGSAEEERLPIKAFIEDDLSICEKSPNEENCERSYYVLKMIKHNFTNCEQIEHEQKKELCELMRAGTSKDCTKVEETTSFTKEWCLAIINEDINECETLEDFEKMECQFSNIVHESINNNNPQNCKKIKKLDYSHIIDKPEHDIDEYLRSFSNVVFYNNYIICKALTTEDLSVYDELIEEKCYLDTVVARANHFACRYSKQEFREECKEKTQELAKCLESDKDIEQKKACINNYTFIDIFCKHAYSRDIESVKNNTKDYTSKREELIHLNPELCVI